MVREVTSSPVSAKRRFCPSQSSLSGPSAHHHIQLTPAFHIHQGTPQSIMVAVHRAMKVEVVSAALTADAAIAR